MSLVSFIGPRPNLFDLAGNARRKRLEVRQPILTNEDLEKIRCIGHFEDSFDTKTLDITYDVEPRRRRDGRTRCSACASAPKRRCSAATTSSSSPTAWSGPTASRSPPCSPPRRCIIT